ncbi:hypothetical protein M0R45_003082 [Rubus argutus]|uniref:EF-hand domain-containing protein n=1 Tax=Rubus argutus TaxID=59490 RepID=A0AAW1YI58_RUBAR
MFSWASSRKSSGVVLGVQRLSSRKLFNKSQPSVSSSPSPISSSGGAFGCHNEYNHKSRSGSSNRSSAFDLILRSVSAGVVILGSYSYGLLFLLDPNACVCFADSKEEATWGLDDLFTSLFPNPFRKRVFFTYEKNERAKFPCKGFPILCIVQTPSGEAFMTPGDLMRAVVPVCPPYDSNRVREGSLRGEQLPGELQCAPSKFFLLFDTDGDGLISFAEYMFFVTLLSIPESSFTVAFKMFDLDNSGDIDREEFNRVMALMRNQNNKNKEGQRIKVGVEDGGLLEYFFGKDGKKGLKHERFVQFLRDLHEEVYLALGFAHYDYKSQGTISAKDFALSLVASADLNDVNKLLIVLTKSAMSHINNIQITYKEFKDFAELRKNLRSFSLAIFSYGEVNGVLTKSDLQRAASKVCGISVTNNVTDIISMYLMQTVMGI